MELSSKLVQERLDLEDMQATHQTKMEQMSSRVKQLGSCQVEQLSGVGAAVIQDVKAAVQAGQAGGGQLGGPAEGDGEEGYKCERG